jgi:ribose-phosphate pyrophosphokinase
LNTVVLPLPGNTSLAAALTTQLGATFGKLTIRSFPDKESYVRVDTPVTGKRIILVCTLDRPDEKFMPLAFTAATARQLGAASVGLVAPYLGYMRQDKRFRSGEGITAEYFGNMLSRSIDWMVTVDPHLHRYHSLSEIYSIPTKVVHAAPLLSKWIQNRIDAPVLIGPDSESLQWVAEVATAAQSPYVILEKIRHGDRDVEVSVPQVAHLRARTPVLVDDIISTARTMIETITHLKHAGLPAPVCVAVHAVMAGAAYKDLLAAGATEVVTCNTILHPSNAIDVMPLIADAVRALNSPTAPITI